MVSLCKSAILYLNESSPLAKFTVIIIIEQFHEMYSFVTLQMHFGEVLQDSKVY